MQVYLRVTFCNQNRGSVDTTQLPPSPSPVGKLDPDKKSSPNITAPAAKAPVPSPIPKHGPALGPEEGLEAGMLMYAPGKQFAVVPGNSVGRKPVLEGGGGGGSVGGRRYPSPVDDDDDDDD